jgi:DNA polymerase-1
MTYFAPGKKRIGFDTETHLIQPGLLVPRCVCVTLAGEGKAPFDIHEGLCVLVKQHTDHWTALLDRGAGAAVMLELFNHPDVNLVAHNLAFDMAVVARLIGEELEVDLFAGLAFDVYDPTTPCATVYDTLLREQLLAIAQDRYAFDVRTGRPPKFNLAELVLNYFGVDITESKKASPAGGGGSDPWRLRYAELDGVPLTEWPEEAIDYAIDDAAWALRVCAAQSKAMDHDGDPPGPLVDTQGHVTDEHQQAAAAFALHLAAAWGVRTDPAMVAEFAEETRLAVEEAAEAGRRAGFVRANGSKDMKALYAVVERAYGGKPPRNAPTKRFPEGSIKTDSDTLAASGDPALIAFGEGSIHRTTLDRYIPQLERGVHAAMTSRPRALKRSGRCAWGDPNQHNPPRRGRYRECHVARPGYLDGTADWSGAELRALAQVCLWWFGESRLAEAFIAGRDPHMELGAQMLGVSYEEALVHPEGPHARQGAKAGNFGYPGGLGTETFVKWCAGQGLDLSRDGTYADAVRHAEEIKSAWFTTWPEVRLYLDEIGRRCQFGPFTAVQCRSNRARGGCTYTSGANTYFQGLIADIAKAALWRVTKECWTGRRGDSDGASPLHGSRVWLLLHDEILIETPEALASAAVQRMAEIMVETAEQYTPDVPHEAEPALMRRWYKKAKPVWGGGVVGGKLLVWEPEQ